MTVSRASRRPWYLLAVAVCAVAASTVTVLLVRDSPTQEPGPGPQQPRFTGYSLVKSGGVAGVNHHVEVSADGTVLYADDQPVAGRLPQATMDRLSSLLADRRLPKEDGGAPPGWTCADAFRYTLTVDGTTVSKEDCGETVTPLLDEIIELTAKDSLEPLPESAPKFRGLTVKYEQMWRNERAKVRITPDGTTVVTANGEPTRRGEVDPGTLDALRILYAEPLRTPSRSTGVECIPEQIPRYEIKVQGRPAVHVSGCGRIDDYRWLARLRIIQNLIRG